MKDDRSVRMKIKKNLKKGLGELDGEVHEVIGRYERREISFEEYLRLRMELELKRIRVVMENLRRLSKAG
ncbi:MAG: hypothetical protein B6U65_00245 [Candidatus Wolframiiraptor sp. EX4484-121]|nr:MAG: hypothetical protein B6U65_00245 [Candidatus Wolframiiraptor sp. EX4484-121]